ncbi:hypothetical protein J437_LFUL017397 [Ladona fulva]|uniref:HTH CENPB-type domain-containing protein n=1 Tax=Ladona fulva TaxID=123851 RepID=A0A8K0P859_LADFU|nr:hypothetical protein J437_LFUL017397 [Ladona fulva]
METTPELPRTPRRRKVITLGTKLEIIQKLEAGMSAAAAGREYDMNESSVRTIWKMADKIKASVAHTGSLNAKITRTRSALLEKMEKLLTKWVEMQTTLGVPTTPAVVRAKALVIYERLKKQQGSDQDEPFMASKGWYDKFCKRTKIQLPKLDKGEEDKP